MHKPTTWRKSRICRTKENSQRFYHYTHTFSIPYNAHNFGMEGSIKKTKKISRISLKIVTQCCAYLNNDKMRQVVGLCKYSLVTYIPILIRRIFTLLVYTVLPYCVIRHVIPSPRESMTQALYCRNDNFSILVDRLIYP